MNWIYGDKGGINWKMDWIYVKNGLFKQVSLETVMATNPWMYSRTQKKQHGKKKKKKIRLMDWI
jgi:hypothetical protein